MIALEVDGQFIDMPQGLSLSFTAVSPLFDLERIGRAYSFPFRIPVTPNNNNVFGHIHRLNVSSAKRRYAAKLYIGNMPTSMVLFQTGYVVVQDRSENEIEISFQNNQIAWLEDMKRTRLKDLAIPVTVPGADYKPFIGLSVVNVEDPVGTETMYIEVNGNLYEALYPVPDAIIDGINADFPGLAYHYTDTGPKITIMLDPNAVDELLINLNPTISDPSVITVFFYPDSVETEREEEVKAAYLDYLNSHSIKNGVTRAGSLKDNAIFVESTKACRKRPPATQIASAPMLTSTSVVTSGLCGNCPSSRAFSSRRGVGSSVFSWPLSSLATLYLLDNLIDTAIRIR